MPCQNDPRHNPPPKSLEIIPQKPKIQCPKIQLYTLLRRPPLAVLGGAHRGALGSGPLIRSPISLEQTIPTQSFFLVPAFFSGARSAKKTLCGLKMMMNFIMSQHPHKVFCSPIGQPQKKTDRESSLFSLS